MWRHSDPLYISAPWTMFSEALEKFGYARMALQVVLNFLNYEFGCVSREALLTYYIIHPDLHVRCHYWSSLLLGCNSARFSRGIVWQNTSLLK